MGRFNDHYWQYTSEIETWSSGGIDERTNEAMGLLLRNGNGIS
jgi:hypothetical protein